MEIEGHSLKRPCVNCPFRTDSTAIRFANRERAEDIEESAYRNGFPCHKTADYVEFDGDHEEHSGYHFGATSQHCVGYSMMLLNAGYDTWPGINNSEATADYIREHVDWNAPVFASVDEFLEANDKAIEAKGVNHA